MFKLFIFIILTMVQVGMFENVYVTNNLILSY